MENIFSDKNFQLRRNKIHEFEYEQIAFDDQIANYE